VSDFVIRRVEPHDFNGVTELLAELGRPASTARSESALREIFFQHVADPDVESLVAEREGVVIGFCSFHFRPRLNFATLEAWIPDLVVTEREHGQGAAVGMFGRAVELAKRRGCHRLTLESGYQRLRAHRFYAREGMTDAGKYFIMDLA
jgi:GNAT superfamily N-acetyltransferase